MTLEELAVILSSLAIVLAGVALIPFFASLWLYFAGGPVMTYEIARMGRSGEGDDETHKIWIRIGCGRKRVLLDNLHVAARQGVRAERDPDATYRSYYNPPAEETYDAFMPLFTIDAERRPLFPRFSIVYSVLLRGADPADSRRPRSLGSEVIPLRVLLDIELDPLRHGFRIIFQPAYRYRLKANVHLELSKPTSETQKGRFERAWR